MILSFHPCIDADIQIILGDRLPDNNEMEFIKKADAIILPQGCSKKLFHICSNSKAVLFPEYSFRFKYPGKVGQIKLFQRFRLPYPCSICWDNLGHLLKNQHKLFYKIPFILKEDKSHEGTGVYIIKELKDIEKISNRLNKTDPLITQELIEAEGNVLRIVIMGKKLYSFWKRPSDSNQLITCISRNAIIDYEWMPHLQDKGKKLVKKLISATGINLAAVDIIFRNNTEPLLLEINYYFGRRWIGGSENYYKLLYKTIKDWLAEKKISSHSLKLSY